MRTLLVLLSSILLLSTAGCGEYIGLKATELPVEQASPEDLGGLPDPATDNSNVSGNADDLQPEDLFSDDDPAQTATPPDGDDAPAPDAPTPQTSAPQATQPPASRPTGVDPKPATPKTKQTPPHIPNPAPAPKTNSGSPSNTQDGKSLGRTLLEMARWVIDHEARKVGPACNFFVQRVLHLMGFTRGQWMANQFDVYAKQSFSTYKTKSFQYDTSGEQSQRLKNYLWSMPEKTGFIFQWKQKVGHGHIAFVHRVQNNLVIYHASLNTALPRAQTIKVETLLHKRRNPYTLNVFSDFKK